MKAYGREINFLRTVGATCKLAESCPDRNIKHLDALFDQDDLAMSQNTLALIISALNEGYELNKSFEDPSYEPHPITVAQLMALDQNTFNALASEAIEAFKTDGPSGQTIEAEPKKNRAARRAAAK